MEFLAENWRWFVLGLYVAEKVVKATPTKKDDIVLDMIIAPIFRSLKKWVKKS